jgi:hypothetical protein
MRAVLAVLTALLAGCSTAVTGEPVAATSQQADRVLIATYFTALDASASQGAAAQLDFLRRTQHPDFRDRLCDLGGVTVDIQPSLSTLAADSDWAPEAAARPRGAVYVVAVSFRVQKDGQVLGEQIGSERVVVLDGSVYGFMPCLRGN